MRILKFALTILLFVAAFPAFAQKFNPYFNFKHLNVENGLAENIVYHFLQDSRGYMWLGTRDGITLFDGIRTLNFQHGEHDPKSLGGDFITRILEDSSHQVWIGHNAGIDRFNPQENNFTHFQIPDANGQFENSYCVPLGFSNSHDLWFIETKSKAIKIFNTRTLRFRQVCLTDMVDGSLYVNPVTKEVHIWSYLSIGTTYLIFNGDSLIRKDRFFSTEKNPKEPSLLIFHVFFQNDSTAWLSSAKGLIALNPLSHLYTIYDSIGKEPVVEARYAALSPKGLLWVSTGGFGIYTFDLNSRKFVDHFRNYTTDPFSICNNNIVSLYFDKVGNIWCGSYGSGVSYANVENKFFSKHLSKNEIDQWKKENAVFWIGADLHDNIWCLLQNVVGFWILDSALNLKEFRRPILENGKLYAGAIYQVYFENDQRAWCTTDRGLFQYDLLTNKMKQIEYPRLSKELFGSYWTQTLIHLHDGSLLLSTLGGLYRISYQNGKQIIQPFSELNDRPFKSFDMIFEDKENNIYVKDIAENLYVLNSGSATGKLSLKKILPFPYDIKQFYEDSANVYVATSQGIFQLHKDNLALEKPLFNSRFPFIGMNDLLLRKNKIWVFGDKGLYYYNLLENKGRLFTTEDGLPSNKFNELCLVITRSGRCIAGTNNGLLSFYPEKLQDTIYPPRAQLMNMYVNDSTKSFIANPQETSKLVLGHDQNTFSFDFSCISFQHADASNYEYMLEAYDEHWIQSGKSHYTRYSKIPPGHYVFNVRVLDASGQISPYSKSIAIDIKKAFWQTTIFYIFVGALLAFFIWILIKWYLNSKIRKQQRGFEKQQAIEKERTRIATDMHDDLGSGLSSIRFLSEKVKRNTFSDVTRNDIDKIMLSSTELIDKMNEIVWAMNEKNDSLADLLVYIRSYAKEYCQENQIDCQIHIPENLPALFVSGEIRRNVFLTIKESLHNIVKHAGASNTELAFGFNGGLHASIRDNGRGYDPALIPKTRGNGLKNMQKRIESLGGRFNILSKEGVIIEIYIPLNI